MRASFVARLATALAAEAPDHALAEVCAIAAEADGDGDPELAPIVANLVAAARLRVAEHERLEMLSAASFEGIIIHRDNVLTDANHRLAEMLGYAGVEDMIGLPLAQLCVAPEDLPEVFRRVRDQIEGEYVITGVRKDGTRFRAELQSKQGRLGDDPIRIVAVRDVTERERTRALLLESEARLRSVVGQAFDFVVYSRDGVVVEVGGRFTETLGFPPEHFIGKRILDLITPSSAPVIEQSLVEARAGGFEATVIDANGDGVPVEVIAVYATLDDQPVRIGAVRDLRTVKRLAHERRVLEQQLERSQRLESLGVLAGGIAHDFNNLLVGVVGNASLLLHVSTDRAVRDAASAIVVAGERAASLTAQMLAYAGHDKHARRAPLDLGALLHEVRALLGAALSKKAQLELDLDPRSVVIGDRATLTQVFMNLLTNASDALGAKPGRIAITSRWLAILDPRWQTALGRPADTAAGWVLVEVRDTGAGMDAATRERVFEPFFSTKAKGHGLGLAACFGIVTSHGGAILVDSELGAGSTFSVLLPASDVAAPVVAPAPIPTMLRSARTVLVVDDEPLVRAVLRRSLEHHGYVVVEAPSGTRALELFATTPATVIILDLTMPDLDGLEVTRRIRASGSKVPILLSSGHLEVFDDRPDDRHLVDGILTKPYGTSELLAALDAALSVSR